MSSDFFYINIINGGKLPVRFSNFLVMESKLQDYLMTTEKADNISKIFVNVSFIVLNWKGEPSFWK